MDKVFITLIGVFLLSGCATSGGEKEGFFSKVSSAISGSYDNVMDESRREKHLVKAPDQVGEIVLSDTASPYIYEDPINVVKVDGIYLGQSEDSLMQAFDLKFDNLNRVIETVDGDPFSYFAPSSLDCKPNYDNLTNSYYRRSNSIFLSFCDSYQLEFPQDISTLFHETLRLQSKNEQGLIKGEILLRSRGKSDSTPFAQSTRYNGVQYGREFVDHKFTTDFRNRLISFAFNKEFPYERNFNETYIAELKQRNPELSIRNMDVVYDGNGNPVDFYIVGGTGKERLVANFTTEETPIPSVRPKSEGYRFLSPTSLDKVYVQSRDNSAPYVITIKCDRVEKKYCYVSHSQTGTTSASQLSNEVLNKDLRARIKENINKWKNGTL